MEKDDVRGKKGEEDKETIVVNDKELHEILLDSSKC